MEEEIVLKGGRANVGNVVRIGDQVARPTYPQTPSVEHFLTHLHDSGLDFVPMPKGTDDQGRNRLSYIEGTAVTPPYQAWAFSEELLIDVARHQRALHQAAQSYQPDDDAVWAVSAGNYFPEQALDADQLVVCHNDLGMPNTITGNSRTNVAGFIDFDYCRPVDPLFDIAVAIRHWAPFGELDMTDAPRLDRIRRFGLFCNQHELAERQRSRVVSLSIAFLDQARDNIQALADAGQVGFQTLLANGYEATNRATVAWLEDNAEALAKTQ